MADCGIFTLAVSILAGVWTVTPAAPGGFGDWDYQATFNSSGKLVDLSAESPDGAIVELEIGNATSQVSGSDVTVTNPATAGTRVIRTCAGRGPEYANLVPGAGRGSIVATRRIARVLALHAVVLVGEARRRVTPGN